MKSPKERLDEYNFALKKLLAQIKKLKKDLSRKEKIYNKLCRKVSWASLIILNIAFLASVFLEIVFSYEMYLDLGSRGISDLISPSVIANILIVLVVVLAAYAAHNLRLLWSKDLRLVEETLYLEKEYSQNEATREVKRNSIKGAIAGFIIGGVVLTGVYFVSLERISLLSVINETIEFSQIEVLLPVIMVFFEIVFGTHLAIAIRLLSLKFSLRSMRLKLKNAEHNEYILKTVIVSCEEIIIIGKSNKDSEDENDSFALSLA